MAIINVFFFFLQRTFTCLGRTHHSASLKSPLFEGSSLREFFRIPKKVGCFFFFWYELSVIASDSFLIWSHKGPIHKAFADHDSICPLFRRHFQVAINLGNKKSHCNFPTCKFLSLSCLHIPQMWISINKFQKGHRAIKNLFYLFF